MRDPEDPGRNDVERSLRARVRTLALEKSYLELVIRLMSRLATAASFEALAENLLHQLVDVIGGTNVILYVPDGHGYLAIDVYGKRWTLEDFDEPDVRKAWESGMPVEQEGPVEASRVTVPLSSAAYTWNFPMIVENHRVGVIRLENLNIGTRMLAHHLPIVFHMAARLIQHERTRQTDPPPPRRVAGTP